MAVSVGSGIAHVPGSLAGTQGTYVCINDAAVQLTIATADGTNDRIDVVVATVRDAFYSGANNDWLLQVVTGTPATIPVLPTLPDNSLTLAEVLVQSGVTVITDADITDRRLLSVSSGGLLPVRDEDERDVLDGLYDGFAVWRIDLKEIQLYDGSLWRRIRGFERVPILSTGTFVKADFPGMIAIRNKLQAPGGGGGGADASAGGVQSFGHGGGGGGYSESILLVSQLSASETVTLPAGGAGGVGEAFGVAGSDASFGGHQTARGGGAGGRDTTASTTPALGGSIGSPGFGGGQIGSPGTGDIVIPGGSGYPGFSLTTTEIIGGNGGDSQLGKGGRGIPANVQVVGSGLPGTGYGGGGGGAGARGSSGPVNGGAGAPSACFTYVYYI
jgi:hypothetical protein